MAKKKAPLAIGSISALEQKRIVDRSDRIVKPRPGIQRTYSIDILKIKSDSPAQKTETPLDTNSP